MKAQPRWLREFLALPECRGWEISMTRGTHVRLVHPEAKGPVFVSLTPSDHRAQKNMLSDMRRALS